MKFATPEYLYLLLFIPLAIVIYHYACYIRRRRLRRYGDPELTARLIPAYSTTRSSVVFWISLLALALVIFALARPRYGKGKTTVTTKGVEMVVALDISNSMLADDIYPNRLEKAKRLISRIINSTGENKVALIVFAGDAFVQLPITNDFISAKMFLESITPALIARQGTDIGAAINLATKSFTPNEKIGKAVIIITDGENHEGGAEEAAMHAAEKGINVYVLGVGTEKGGRIPVDGKNDYIRDKDGFVVVSKLNEDMANRIAKAGRGTYVRVDNTNNAQTIIANELDKLQQDDVKTDVYTKYKEQFEVIALIVFILLIAEIVITVVLDSINQGKKNRKANK